jgi:hypothetical protein
MRDSLQPLISLGGASFFRSVESSVLAGHTHIRDALRPPMYHSMAQIAVAIIGDVNQGDL